MNVNQIKQVRTHINNFNNLNFAVIVSEAFGDNIDLGGVNIQDYSALEYIESVERVFITLNQADQEGWFKSLPFQYQLGTEFGNGNLNADLNALVSQIKTNQFSQSIQILNRLLLYIASNGLYSRTSKILTSTDAASEHKKLSAISSHISRVLKDLEGLKANIEESKIGLDNFTVSKRKEISEIESLLDSTRKYADEVSDTNIEFSNLLIKSTGQIEANEERQGELSATIRNAQNLVDEYTKELHDKQEALVSQLTKFDEKQGEFQAHLESMGDKHAEYEKRSSYLDDLIGREVGASLFETFKQRKNELNRPIFWWRIAVGLSSAFALAWIVSLFNGTSLAELTWQSFAVNSLKTLPAFAVLYFSISQYTKERHFQEEYAFKSAVALTVNSYASQLKGEENQDKLIMESVEQIYRTPIDKKLDQNFTAKEVKEQVATVKDIVKDAKAMLKNN
ncbi:hypothetical protein ACPV5J_05225 [Vibrio rotiferianus]|uniref:hypothetical protein n=1 Tax=Vibrio rotiferianus TaxID=190895 RepID=UPI00406A835A